MVSAADPVLLPTSKGTVEDGTVVNQYGNPELMADFAEEYLRQFWTIMPIGRLPYSLKEILPALLLLFTATEPALKAFRIRSGTQMTGHSLTDLYQELDPEHRKDIEERFAKSEPILALSALSTDAPTVVPATYTMFREASGLRAANLAKGNTPYPIFLPCVVRSLIDTCRFYSGPERLRRLGADLSEDGDERNSDNHGEWGLIPSS